MSEGKNIKKYSVTDIERYHKGQLTAKERHDLEKAALDDPFLADALEGYALTGIHANADIADLKNRLAERLEKDTARVVPLTKRYSFLRVAVAVVLLVGTAILLYQMMFQKHETKEIAEIPANNVQKNNTDTTINNFNSGSGAISGTNELKFLDTNKPAPERRELAKTEVKKPDAGYYEDKVKDKEGPVVIGETKTVSPVTTTTVPAGRADDNKQLAKEKAQPPKNERDSAPEDRTAMGNKVSAEELRYRNQAMNTFKGKVTDNSERGVPFAKVTNVQDHDAGTYTDANGNFTLLSADSVLNVQVRSIGFENTNNIQLRNDRSNTVKLDEDRSSMTEVVINRQMPNASARSMRKSNVTVTEPEPVDGWKKYDSYLANNIDVPDDFKPQEKDNNTVEVSFEVDNTGEPVNIKVEKSLCSSCDKEAIRLIKEGPKWKNNASRKGRTTVTIKF